MPKIDKDKWVDIITDYLRYNLSDAQAYITGCYFDEDVAKDSLSELERYLCIRAIAKHLEKDLQHIIKDGAYATEYTYFGHTGHNNPQPMITDEYFIKVDFRVKNELFDICDYMGLFRESNFYITKDNA